MRLPTVIEAADSTNRTGVTTLLLPRKQKNTTLISATNPAAFDATARKAVTGVGAPS